MKNYKILYEDDSLFVLWKRSGVPVQSARASVPDIMSMLQNELAERNIPGSYLGLVNRLDQPVEGIFLVARDKKAAADLSMQVQDHIHMEKWYQALVCGKLPADEGTLVDYLLKEQQKNISRVVSEGTKGARRSELRYQVIGQRDGKCLLKIRLLTGRHHQIRLQLSHAGAPVVGDQKYGKPEEKGRSLALCACELAFRHPVTGEKMRFLEPPTFSLAD